MKPVNLLRRAKLVTGFLLAISTTFASAESITSWGSNTYGQLVNSVAGVKSIAAGGWHCLILKNDGTVTCQGLNADGECNVPSGLTGVVAVSAGETHSAALKSDGTVVCWGADNQGQVDVPPSLTNVKAIAMGGNNSMALLNDGTIVQWGAFRTPPGSGLTNIVSIASNRGHSMAVKADGTVACWGGLNLYGQRNVPAGLNTVVAVAAGWNHSMALKADGTIVCWGDNSKGQKDIATGLTGVRSIAAGGNTSVALTDGGAIVSSGDGAAGQRTVPAGFPGATAVAVGYFFTMGASGDVEMSSASCVGGSTIALKANLYDLPVASYTRTVTVSTSDTAHSGVPATFVIPAGISKASVTVRHEMVDTATPITVTVSGPGVVGSSSFTLQPFAVKLLVVDGNKREGGNSCTGTVVMNASPKAPLTLSLSSDQPLAVTLPSTATIYTGNTNVTFAVATSEVGTDTTANITVGASLIASKSAPLTIYAKAQVSSLKLSKTTAYGNQKITGTITIVSKHSQSDTVVSLSASVAGVSLPSSVTIPNGSTTATFDITADDVAADTALTVTASTPFAARGVNMTVKPMLVKTLTLTPDTISAGTDSTGSVVLSVPVDFDTVVDLTASKAGATMPACVTILAGSDTATFTITADATTKTKTIQIKAGRKGVWKQKPLTIVP